jgi:hypothetical protein
MQKARRGSHQRRSLSLCLKPVASLLSLWSSGSFCRSFSNKICIFGGSGS